MNSRSGGASRCGAIRGRGRNEGGGLGEDKVVDSTGGGPKHMARSRCYLVMILVVLCTYNRTEDSRRRWLSGGEGSGPGRCHFALVRLLLFFPGVAKRRFILANNLLVKSCLSGCRCRRYWSFGIGGDEVQNQILCPPAIRIILHLLGWRPKAAQSWLPKFRPHGQDSWVDNVSQSGFVRMGAGDDAATE